LRRRWRIVRICARTHTQEHVHARTPRSTHAYVHARARTHAHTHANTRSLTHSRTVPPLWAFLFKLVHAHACIMMRWHGDACQSACVHSHTRAHVVQCIFAFVGHLGIELFNSRSRRAIFNTISGKMSRSEVRVTKRPRASVRACAIHRLYFKTHKCAVKKTGPGPVRQAWAPCVSRLSGDPDNCSLSASSPRPS
jgi:hypothetical protein